MKVVEMRQVVVPERKEGEKSEYIAIYIFGFIIYGNTVLYKER